MGEHDTRIRFLHDAFNGIATFPSNTVNFLKIMVASVFKFIGWCLSYARAPGCRINPVFGLSETLALALHHESSLFPVPGTKGGDRRLVPDRYIVQAKRGGTEHQGKTRAGPADVSGNFRAYEGECDTQLMMNSHETAMLVPYL
jgi:hypothetical protein